MPDYLYYRRGDEWVRVDADSYERKHESDPNYTPLGKCENVRYNVGYYIYYIYAYGGAERRVYVYWSGVYGPITKIDAGADGVVYGAIKTRDGVLTSVKAQDGAGVLRFPEELYIARFDGGPDNCGDPNGGVGKCTTVFKRNGSIVLALDSCPDVTNGDECADCCKELLPMARSITI